MMVKNSKMFKVVFGVTFQNHRQMIGCQLFSKAELRFPIVRRGPDRIRSLGKPPANAAFLTVKSQ
jgi:hypothetical protein